ncbi:undecaprenyl-diphosphate phosphatase [Caldimonas thermodepolymerans]|jgi:undecaprenyl-diphosphatase UppP|uniref:undecaprenyl-diphosphate phosphatase n=1 Tax=Caldimonas thermodepolymerans TaxID=215580 RepID=UPI00249255AA|nr:undecaprenyl-diphosphate phosphatase [Caldimonas thermodepolymerans]
MQTMIEWWQAVLLATVQGLSEFLPISSSGHLVLLPRLFGWTDQGLAFDVAVHVGTLLGVLVYFRRDLLPLARGGIAFVSGDREDPHGRLAFNLIVGTIPVGVVGLLFNDVIEEKLRSPLVVAFQLAVFGIVLWLADRLSARSRSESSLSVGQALLIGCAQALALVPGTSRSGITMSAALALGLTREAAARFAFLLAIPGIAMAGAYEGYRFFTSEGTVAVREMLIGVAVSAVVGYACIHYFLKFIARIGFAPFAIYRLLLAGVIVALFY